MLSTTIKKSILTKNRNYMAWFNRACIYSIKGDKEKALSNLKKAVEINISCKEDAKKDKDFEKLWEDKDFKKRVE